MPDFPQVAHSPWSYRVMEQARKVRPSHWLPLILPVRVVGRDFSDTESALYGADSIVAAWTAAAGPPIETFLVWQLTTTAFQVQVLEAEVIVIDSATGLRVRDGFVQIKVWDQTPSGWVFDTQGVVPLSLFGQPGPITQTVVVEGFAAALPGSGFQQFPIDRAFKPDADAPLFIGPGQAVTISVRQAQTLGASAPPYLVSGGFIWREPETTREV